MQTEPDYLAQLIERAVSAAGNENKLAAQLGVNRQAVNNWKHGKNTCPVADQVLMAEIAGLKPEEWAARALVAQYEGTAKGDKLFIALRKLLVATGGAVASFGESAHPIFSHDAITSFVQFIRCALLLSKRQVNYRSCKLATYTA